MTNTRWVALLAALSMWIAPASARDANAVADLTVTHPDLDGDGGAVRLFEGSRRKSGQWSVSGRGDLAEASFSATGVADLLAHAPPVYMNQNVFGTTASANLWGGEVLNFHVAGASSDTVTRIKLAVRLSGTIASILNVAPAAAGLDYCVGKAGTDPCAAPPPEVAALLNLPPPSGVMQGSAGGIRHEAPDWTFDDRMRSTIDIVGADAVVPLWYFGQVYAGANPYYDLTVDVQASIRWTIKLPDGVTCTSRSGHAFKGQCPAARQAEPRL